MIIYFTGTGNSRYVAKAIGAALGDEVVSMNELMKSGNRETLKSVKSFVFVVPTYAWRMPRVVEEFVAEDRYKGNKNAYFIMTCADKIGNASAYVEKLCAKSGLEFCGIKSVVMPSNYIVMYDTPSDVQISEAIKKADTVLGQIAKSIENGQKLSDQNVGFGDKMLSGMVNSIFYGSMIRAKGFYATDDCIGCKKCVKACPLNNIKMLDGKPSWGKDCTHCMACICGCPKNAIEYGKKTKDRKRYICPEFSEK